MPLSIVKEATQTLRLPASEVKALTKAAIVLDEKAQIAQDIKFLKQNGYRNPRYLGGGVYGKVYQVEVLDEAKKSTWKTVAVKVTQNSVQGMDEMIRESYLLRQIGNFPNLASAQQVVLYPHLDGYSTIVVTQMPLYKQDLKHLLSSITSFSAGQFISMVWDLFCGVKTLHLHHIGHYDLKPENILWDGIHLKIADFGLVLFLDTLFRRTREQLMTRTYRPPEMMCDLGNGKELPNAVSLKADMWSLGLILLEMLHAYLVGRPKRAWDTKTFSDWSSNIWEAKTLTNLFQLKGVDPKFWKQCFPEVDIPTGLYVKESSPGSTDGQAIFEKLFHIHHNHFLDRWKGHVPLDLKEALPHLFTIVSHLLRIDAKQRWTATQVLDELGKIHTEHPLFLDCHTHPPKPIQDSKWQPETVTLYKMVSHSPTLKWHELKRLEDQLNKINSAFVALTKVFQQPPTSLERKSAFAVATLLHWGGITFETWFLEHYKTWGFPSLKSLVSSVDYLLNVIFRPGAPSLDLQ